ncbi:MAG: glutaredoxin family protein [Gammaproteobacteria bacterium]|nr:glutaredoxin family protein [Gammaproteobacteria bacterium]
MKQLTLYSTDGCHLCDEAMMLLDQIGAIYQVQDIIDDASLVEKYGIKIPVLAKPTGDELDWPFDVAALTQFMEQ